MLTESGTKECVADVHEFMVASCDGDTKGNRDSFPEELFGSV